MKNTYRHLRPGDVFSAAYNVCTVVELPEWEPVEAFGEVADVGHIKVITGEGVTFELFCNADDPA